MAGNAARLAAARRHVRVDGVATECGMARGDPERFPALLAAHTQTAELERRRNGVPATSGRIAQTSVGHAGCLFLGEPANPRKTSTA